MPFLTGASPSRTSGGSNGKTKRGKDKSSSLITSATASVSSSPRRTKQLSPGLKGWHHRDYDHSSYIHEPEYVYAGPSTVESLYNGWKHGSTMHSGRSGTMVFNAPSPSSSVGSPFRPLPGRILPWAGLRTNTDSEWASHSLAASPGGQSSAPLKTLSSDYSRKTLQRGLSKAFTRSVGPPISSAVFQVVKLARINDQRGLREYFNVWVNAEALRQQQRLMDVQKEAMLDLEGSLRNKLSAAMEEVGRLRKQVTSAKAPPETALPQVEVDEACVARLEEIWNGPVKAWQSRILGAAWSRWSGQARIGRTTRQLETPVPHNVAPEPSPSQEAIGLLLDTALETPRRHFVKAAWRRWWRFVHLAVSWDAASAANARVVELGAHVAQLAGSMEYLRKRAMTPRPGDAASGTVIATGEGVHGELEAQRRRIAELENQTHHQLEVDSLKRKNAELEVAVAAKSESAKETQHQLEVESFKRKIAELEVAVATKSEALVTLSTEQRRQMSGLEAASATQSAVLVTARAEIESQRSQIAELEGALAAAVSECEAPKAELKEHKAALETHKSRIGEKEAELEMHKVRITELQASKRELESHKSHMAGREKTHMGRITELEASARELETHRSHLAAREAELETHKGRIAELEASIRHSAQWALRTAVRHWCKKREAAAWKQWCLSLSIDDHRVAVAEGKENSALAYATVGNFRRRMAEFVIQRLVGHHLRAAHLKIAWKTIWQATMYQANLEQENRALLERVQAMEAQISKATVDAIKAVAVASREGEKKGRELGSKQMQTIVREFILMAPGSKRAKLKLKATWNYWCKSTEESKAAAEVAKKKEAEDPIGAALENVFGGWQAPWDTPVNSPTKVAGQKSGKGGGGEPETKPQAPWGAWGT